MIKLLTILLLSTSILIGTPNTEETIATPEIIETTPEIEIKQDVKRICGWPDDHKDIPSETKDGKVWCHRCLHKWASY